MVRPEMKVNRSAINSGSKTKLPCPQTNPTPQWNLMKMWGVLGADTGPLISEKRFQLNTNQAGSVALVCIWCPACQPLTQELPAAIESDVKQEVGEERL